MKSFLLALACGVCTLAASPAFSQDKPADNTAILQDKLRADKKLLVASNLPLVEREAIQFWPVYDAYQIDLAAVDARVAGIILDYQEADSTGTLNDTVARKLAEKMLAVEDDEAKLRHRYFAKLLQVLPPVKVARYLQIEGKIRAAKGYEITSRIPLIEERKPDQNHASSPRI